MARKTLRAAAPRHDPAEQVAGDLVGAEPALAAERAGDAVLVLEAEDAPVHARQRYRSRRPACGSGTGRRGGARSRMVHIRPRASAFEAQVIAARLGAEGIVWELRGARAARTRWARRESSSEDDVERARQLLLADDIESAFERRRRPPSARPGPPRPGPPARSPLGVPAPAARRAAGRSGPTSRRIDSTSQRRSRPPSVCRSGVARPGSGASPRPRNGPGQPAGATVVVATSRAPSTRGGAGPWRGRAWVTALPLVAVPALASSPPSGVPDASPPGGSRYSDLGSEGIVTQLPGVGGSRPVPIRPRARSRAGSSAAPDWPRPRRSSSRPLANEVEAPPSRWSTTSGTGPDDGAGPGQPFAILASLALFTLARLVVVLDRGGRLGAPLRSGQARRPRGRRPSVRSGPGQGRWRRHPQGVPRSALSPRPRPAGRRWSRPRRRARVKRSSSMTVPS